MAREVARIKQIREVTSYGVAFHFDFFKCLSLVGKLGQLFIILFLLII